MLTGLYAVVIIKIKDFSENYTCFLPNEIMSVDWTQQQATDFPVVFLIKVNGVVREDHFVFISKDLKHDIPFVKICSSIINKY